MCKYIRKPPLDPKGIKTHTSEEYITTGHYALQELAHEQPSPTLDDAGQAAVVKLFIDLQFAHEYVVKVAKDIAKLGAVTTPSQFCFIMRRAVQPLIQIQVPPQLLSPANWNFVKERLTEEELEEEEGSIRCFHSLSTPHWLNLMKNTQPDVPLWQSTGYFGGQLSRPMFHKTKWLRNSECHPRSYMRQSQDENMTQDKN